MPEAGMDICLIIAREYIEDLVVATMLPGK